MLLLDAMHTSPIRTAVRPLSAESVTAVWERYGFHYFNIRYADGRRSTEPARLLSGNADVQMRLTDWRPLHRHDSLSDFVKPEPTEQTCPIHLPPGTTIDNLRFAPGIDWYTSAGASPYVELAPREPCPDCRGTGEYVGLTRTGPCQMCRGTGDFMVNGERVE